MRWIILACATMLLPSIARAEDGDAPTKKMASPGLMGVGIGVTALGATALPIGILFSMFHSEPACVWDFRDPNGCKAGIDGLQAFGVGTVIGSSIAIVGGVTMIVLGARRVPVTVTAGGPRGSAGFQMSVSFE